MQREIMPSVLCTKVQKASRDARTAESFLDVQGATQAVSAPHHQNVRGVWIEAVHDRVVAGVADVRAMQAPTLAATATGYDVREGS